MGRAKRRGEQREQKSKKARANGRGEQSERECEEKGQKLRGKWECVEKGIAKEMEVSAIER